MAADLNYRKSRKSNFSPEEIDTLVSNVMQNHDVLYGQNSKSHHNKDVRMSVWNYVLDEVNKVSFERRTLQEVKNKWKKCHHLVKQNEYLDSSIDDELVDVWGPLECFEDSMPLQQRLSQSAPDLPQNQEAVLQSQCLSPTKLKVTRQAAKPQAPPPKTPSPQLPNEEVCLRWNSHHSNMQAAFPNLLLKEQYVDATLVTEGKTLKCHRMILSSCSPYFEEVLSGISPLQHPVLFMRDVPFWILKALCDFMYAGEVHIFQNRLEELLKVAEILQIKGLAGRPDTKEEVKPIVPERIKQEADLITPPLLPKQSPLVRQKELKEPKEEKDKKKEDKKAKFYQIAKEEFPKLSPKPSTSRTALKSSHTHSQKRPDRNRGHQQIENSKEKEKERVPLKKGNIIDPLDLLEPVYEEITKDPVLLKPILAPRNKETKHVPLKRNVSKKVKKRRYVEDREESPPLMFQSRKGTRSRPNVKVPKFFHSHYEPPVKETGDTPIVREPHTVQNDPLIPVEDIKAEPLDVEDTIIDTEDNLVNFMDQEMTSQEEEIIGNYDSPIVNMKSPETPPVTSSSTPFQKIKLLPQPVIMDVHTVTENVQVNLKVLDVNKDSVKLVDISKLGAGQEETSSSSGSVDPLDSSNILISNVQSVSEDGSESRDTNVEDKSKTEEASKDSQELNFRIESVVSENFEDTDARGESDFAPPSAEECTNTEETVVPTIAEENESCQANLELPQCNNTHSEEEEIEESTKEATNTPQSEELAISQEDEDKILESTEETLGLLEEADNIEVENNKPECGEDTGQLEDSLLEDLEEEDIIMKNVSPVESSEKGSEKTLEMIVNDLNESLGEMMKEGDGLGSDTNETL